jgi:hypothetical protein
VNALARISLTGAALATLAATLLGVTYLREIAGTGLSRYAAEAGAWLGSTELALSNAAAERIGGRAIRDRSELARPRSLLLGAHDDGLPSSVSGLLALEKALSEPLLFMQLYNAWGDGSDHTFPIREARAVWAAGSVPLITWEPWLSAFDSGKHEHLRPVSERDHGGLADIAAGHYDFYVDAWARTAAAFEHPLFVRFAHEMNDSYRYPWGPSHNPNPEHFVAAFRHVVQRFRAAGALNVLWVWAPSISYAGYETRYPGASFVDWVGTGVLNYGNAARWSRFQSADEILRAHYARLAAYGKPLMIAEFGSVASGGDRARWYEDALAMLPRSYPAVRALLFFHVQTDRTVTNEPLRWSFADDVSVVAAARRGLARGRAAPVTNPDSSKDGVR